MHFDDGRLPAEYRRYLAAKARVIEEVDRELPRRPQRGLARARRSRGALRRVDRRQRGAELQRPQTGRQPGHVAEIDDMQPAAGPEAGQRGIQPRIRADHQKLVAAGPGGKGSLVRVQYAVKGQEQ